MYKKTKKIIPRPEMSWNQENATNYEYYSIHHHQEKVNKISWHWSQIPEYVLYESGFIHDYNKLRMKRKNVYQTEERYYNPIREYGLDGISFDGTSYHGIQSKLYEKTLTSNDLGTFYSAIFNRMKIKNSLSKGYLYHSCKLQIDLKDDIDNSTGNIVRSLLSYDESIQNDFLKSFSVSEDIEITHETNYILRPYQQEAVDALNQQWSGIKLLNLPCGTGKTVIFCNHVKEKRYKNVFILSPLKVHVRQNLERMKEFLPDYETLLLDSDSDGSTDIDDLTSMLDKNGIISSTFESAENVIQYLFEKDEDEEIGYQPIVDLSDSILIIDEAHNMIHKDKLVEIIQAFPKVLLVTATPPSSMEEIIGSELIFQYPFRQAIEEKYICDYQIYLPMLFQDEKTGVSNVAIEKPVEMHDYDDDMTKKCLYLANGMLQTGSRRCIVYMNSCEECEEFTMIWKKMMREYHYLHEWIHILTSEISEKDRERMILEFEKESKDTLKIICSIRILNEGVDIPKCDSVFIGNVGEHANNITMVQRMCRANRLVKENPNKVANCFLWTDDMNKIVGSLSLLKENDMEFHKKIRVMNGDYDKQGDREMIEKIEMENKKVNEFVRIKCLSYQDIWKMKKELLFKFCDENGKVPEWKDKYEEYNIGLWLNNQKRKINSMDSDVYKYLSENDIIKKELNRYLQCKDINKCKERLTWSQSKNIIIQFIENKRRIPTEKEKFKEHSIGKWLSDQKKKIISIESNIYIKLSNNKIIKNELDRYLQYKEKNKDKVKLTWDESKNLLFQFIEKEGTIPLWKDNYETYKIGQWFNDQKKRINQDIYTKLSENKIIKNELDRYLQYKEKNKDKVKLTWDESKNLLFQFIEKEGTIPLWKDNYETYNIGQWFNDQKKKINSIESDIYKKLSENEIVKKELDRYLQNKKK